MRECFSCGWVIAQQIKVIEDIKTTTGEGDGYLSIYRG